MEIFGGFMAMMSIIGLFLAVVWLIMPFVVFAIKGKQDRSLELLETIEKRLTGIDEKLTRLQSEQPPQPTPAEFPADEVMPASNHNLQPPVLPLA
jgi:hypothetical protein